jgi:uncharacterized protein (TIGR02147 family)
MKAEVFDFTDYKSFVRFRIEMPENARGYSARLARSAGMHGSFLSKVLNSHVHLTPDQGADFCSFWGLDRDESAYFLGLLNLARSSSKNLQTLIREELRVLRKRREDLSRRFHRAEAIEDGGTARYYSSWHVICVHLLLQIPQYRTPQQIAKRLGLPVELVKATLASLAEMKLAEEQAGQWKAKRADLHLSRDSVWANVHYANWLMRTITRLQEGAPQEVAFSSVLAISRATADEMKRLLIRDLERLRAQAVDSNAEDLYYLGLHFYPV